jgi:CubicO group peptidase (beta-lactamase class C family)
MQRSNLSRWYLLCLALLAFCGAAVAQEPLKASPEKAGLSADKLQRIDALFQDIVEKRQIAGAVVLLARHGNLGYLHGLGMQDAEAKTPMTAGTIFRIASMTKPVTSVAAMMLVDRGQLKLDDPIAHYVPEFKQLKVLAPDKASGAAAYTTVPAESPISVRHLLTHTSGLTYRFLGRPNLGDLYRDAGVEDGLVQAEGTIGDNVKRLAKLPLLHQPGSAWEYGLNADVLGRVIEVASGKDLDTFFREEIFRPLRMSDTYFFLPGEKKNRLAALYAPDTQKSITRIGEEPVKAGALVYSASYPYKGPRTYFSGGAGLVSTASDYARFLQMLLGGGQLDGARLLKPETVKQMTENQIGSLRMELGGADFPGSRFGYGFGILVDPKKATDVASVGTYTWGGIFNTYFWVDPEKELIGVMMTQLYPSGHLTLARDLKKRTYESIK